MRLIKFLGMIVVKVRLLTMLIGIIFLLSLFIFSARREVDNFVFAVMVAIVFVFHISLSGSYEYMIMDVCRDIRKSLSYVFCVVNELWVASGEKGKRDG